MRVEARDTNSTVSGTGWIPFDVEYKGPAELDIVSALGDPVTATLRVEWQETNPQTASFIATEVAVESEEEGEVVFFRTSDANVTSANYDWPVSGRAYVMKIRRIVLEDAEEVAGRWTVTSLSVDYFPRYFLKDARKPEVMVSFVPKKGAIPGFASNVSVDEYQPLFLSEGGGPQVGSPIHVVSPHRWRSGDFETSLEEDRGFLVGEEQQQIAAEEIERGSRFGCFLRHVPSAKSFCVINEISYTVNELEENQISVSWTESRFDEDIYLRGIVGIDG